MGTFYISEYVHVTSLSGHYNCLNMFTLRLCVDTCLLNKKSNPYVSRSEYLTKT